jgi:thiol-disulfide isomerase/thioredoxin
MVPYLYIYIYIYIMNKHIHIDNPLKIPEFDALIKERPVVIMYYMPGCHHCDAMKPEWDRFEKSLKSKNHHVGTARVNSNHMNGVKGSERVSGFPTVLLIEDEKVKSEYSGDRTAEDLERFTNSNVSPVSTSSQTHSTTEESMSRNLETPVTDVTETVATENIFDPLFSKTKSKTKSRTRRKAISRKRTKIKSKTRRKAISRKRSKSKSNSKRKTTSRKRSKSKSNSKRKTRRNTQSRKSSTVRISPTPSTTERGLEELFDM